MANITGQVFIDHGDDGTRNANDAGLAGIQVQVFDATGAAAGSATTVYCTGAGAPVADCASATDAGHYNVAVAGTAPFRVEFILPAGVEPSQFGAESGTTVQFVATANESGVDLGVLSPSLFCEDDPRVAVSCYEEGSATGNANSAYVSWPWTQAGDAVPPRSDATIGELGTVWGAAYQRATQRIFTTAVVRRHSGLGDQGTGGVYVLDYATAGVPLATKFDLAGVVPDNGGAALDFGNVCRAAGACVTAGTGIVADYTLAAGGMPSIDLDAYNKVGRAGIGDADMAGDDKTLWLVNLNDAELISVDVSGDAGSLPGAVNRFAVSGSGDWPVCADASPFVPWGLAFRLGRGFLGGVCTAESSSDPANLAAFVLEFDPADPVGTLTEVLTFSLAFNREESVVGDKPGEWQDWTTVWPHGNNNAFFQFFVGRPSPILSDIDFASDGSMILGFIDRHGMQLASYQAPAVSGGGTNNYSATMAGDIMRVCDVDGVWRPAGHADCPSGDAGAAPNELDDGPFGGGEFFNEDRLLSGASHMEVATGSVSVLPGSTEVMSTVIDPFVIDTSGVHRYSTVDGSKNAGYLVYSGGGSGANPIVNKAQALGDLELACSPAPVQVGNYIWSDTDENGVMDPGEPALGGVGVSVYDDSGNLIGMTTTDGSGRYLFDFAQSAIVDPDPMDNQILLADPFDANYYIEVKASNFNAGQPLDGLTAATPDNDGSAGGDKRDSDGVAINIPGVGAGLGVQFTLGSHGQNNHSYDFGFVGAVAVPDLSLGNRVWLDMGVGVGELNNGQLDAGESGIASVQVELLNAAGAPVDLGSGPVTTTTDAQGHYLFDNLPAGTYRVRLSASNFGTGQPLAGLVSSTPTELTPDSDIDSNDNGIDAATPTTTGITSGPVTLALNLEPIGETDLGALGPGGAENDDSNLTVDFGLFQPLSLGNLVWSDADNSGDVNAGELGIPGVTLNLLDGAGVPVLGGDGLPRTTTTDASGHYLFDLLAPGVYMVEIPATEFQPGGVLSGGTSSNGPAEEGDPNLDGDDNDNGVDPADAAVDGVRSNPVTITYTAEPLAEGDPSGNATDSNSNLTVDFGIFGVVIEIYTVPTLGGAGLMTLLALISLLAMRRLRRIS